VSRNQISRFFQDQPFAAIGASALLLSAAFPPVPLPWLIWIAWVPILLLLHHLPEKAPENLWLFKIKKPFIYIWRVLTLAFFWNKSSWKHIQRKEISRTRQTVYYLYITFFIWNISTCYWLMLTALSVPTGEAVSSFLAGFFASAANPVLMSIPVLLWLRFHHRLPLILSGMLFISLWIIFEYLHYHWDLSWAWITLGNSMSGAPDFIQFAEFTGIEGISLWILIINFLVFSSLVKARFFPALSALGLGFLPLLLNLWILNPEREVFQPEASLNVRIVQPNIDPYVKFDADDLERQLNTFYQLAGAPGADTIDLVVFPETAIPEAVWSHEISSNESMKGFWTLTGRYPAMSILTGFTELRYFKHPPYPVTARPLDEGYYDYCNSAVILGSSRMRTYQKSWLVPMVERVPFLDYLSFLKDYNIDIGGGFGSYGRSDSAFNLYTRSGVPVGVMICYESAFPDHVREYTRKGARVLSVITNDGWWKKSSGYIQHAGLSVIRAIENRREIVRSANTGISMFVDVRGRKFQETNWWEEAYIDQKVNEYTSLTFYVKHGEYISFIMMFLAAGVLFFGIIKKYKTKPEPE